MCKKTFVFELQEFVCLEPIRTHKFLNRISDFVSIICVLIAMFRLVIEKG